MSLHGVEAFRAVSAVMAGRVAPDSVVIADVGLERLRRALADGTASPLDVAVLVRHVLLGEERRRGGGPKPRLPAPAGLAACAAIAGLQVEDGQLRALPWLPGWANQVVHDPALVAAAAERVRFGSEDVGPSADPCMERLGRTRYRSVGQRAAIRSALLTPPGATTAIDLPTGEGKSLVFQAIDEVGFASDSPLAAAEGVTLVVVPTVALAYDHENACRETDGEPLAYVGGSDEECRAEIRARVGKENRGLVFAAPEAACRSLRPALIDAARAGRLKAIVVDEAHLVDAWGTGFRTDFQSLSGLRRELLEAAPHDRGPRTILLSATLTPETLDTLRVLFSNPGEFRLLSAGQVRPEPEYWTASPSTADERTARVVEALCRLPRPAILYVTEVAEAKAWGKRLLDLGFRRLATFHGQTPDALRKRTLDRWRDGDLDLVVATSAFGLGIDYPHVRTVVHACVPETFDRFYQEVGRGGRDGCASVSMVIPSHRDFEVARRLNQETVISVERGLTRWKAMFEHPDATHLGGMMFRLRLDVAPGHSTEDIDLVGEQSLQWNARVLTLLARVGILRLVGAQNGVAETARPEDQEEDHATGVFETVEILETGHLLEDVWRRRVEPVRQSIWAGRQRNLGLMLEHLRSRRCPTSLLVDLYGRTSLEPICTACGLCRSDASVKKPSVLRREPAPCWSAPILRGALGAMTSGGGDVVLTYRNSDNGLAARRRWANAFTSFWRGGLRALVLVGDPPDIFERAMEGLRKVPVFVAASNGAVPPRLPTGPRVVLVAPGRTVLLSSNAPGSATRLLIVPDNMQDMERPGEFALERFSGLVLDLDSFLARLH
ncbi:protein DpdF [Microvirga alba]|uniref:ATP-dependent DNA helicase RecQ n=1 Tax=Microvirga alba TaxID=2791025 RepID=A0A931FTY6_9HYPH|nr:protein DpdF [Microvirga alba]MBF9235116.1 ATP-dependent DNA helicase RecQ [Microvirga alba]